MNTAAKCLVAIIVVMTTLGSVSLANKVNVSAYGDDLKIDLYTQKEPYSGRGLNQPSDAFAPQEDMQLYAYVTYYDDPVEGKLVAFQVSDPLGNTVLFRSSVTNAYGIASMSFRIPSEPMFGQWTAFATVEITGRIVNDTLTFKVGWIVELISLRTINQNYTAQDVFVRGSYVGIEICLRNIAISQKTTYLTITIFDSLKNSINSTAIDNFVVPPNDVPCYTYVFLYIPPNTVRGKATIYAGAYTGPISSNGVPYCPEISKHITIVGQTFFLNVETDPPNIVTIPGEGLYEEGTYVNLTAPNYVNISADIRYRFAYWDIDGVPSFGNLVSVLMDGNHNATAHFIAQYLLTFTQMGLDSSASGTILTVGDVSKTFNNLPFSFWVDHNTIVTYHYNEVIASAISGKRFNLTEIVG
ncbi:MAG: hypothetical protein KIH09_17470, partial [Candidatus Freyarchaeota archaeon]|nr:hypothetical protein [Candidatus Jordarchaeia archaeon]